jgi:RsmE family RNA methyltransferase
VNIILFEKKEISPDMSGFLLRRDKRAAHLIKVLRKKEGDVFEAGILVDEKSGADRQTIDLQSSIGTGRILSISQDGIKFSLELASPPPPRVPIILGVGFPRPIQLRRLLRDAANFGIEEVDVFGTELGEKSYRDTNLLIDGGAREALLEGAVQARDVRIPRLAVFPDIKSWLETVPGTYLRFAADNAGTEKTVPGTIFAAVLAIGSERGFSGSERHQLDENNFVSFSLGPRALRTETAAVAGIAVLMEKLGRN